MNKITLIIVILSSISLSTRVLAYEDYESCILESMKGISSDIAAVEIIRACREKYPSTPQPLRPVEETECFKVPIEIQSTEWVNRDPNDSSWTSWYRVENSMIFRVILKSASKSPIDIVSMSYAFTEKSSCSGAALSNEYPSNTKNPFQNIKLKHTSSERVIYEIEMYKPEVNNKLCYIVTAMNCKKTIKWK